jgi:hypothetical protein
MISARKQLAVTCRLPSSHGKTGGSASYSDGHVFGEPVFVGCPGGADEDDWVLLSVGSARGGALALPAEDDGRWPTPLSFQNTFVPAEP